MGGRPSPSSCCPICHRSQIETVTITSLTHASLNIKTVRIWAHNLSKLVWHIDLMTCYVDFIILPRGLRTPFVISRDVPSRRRATHILTRSLMDNAGSIPVLFLGLVPTCWRRRCFLLRVSITIVTKTRFKLIVVVGFAYAKPNLMETLFLGLSFVHERDENSMLFLWSWIV